MFHVSGPAPGLLTAALLVVLCLVAGGTVLYLVTLLLSALAAKRHRSASRSPLPPGRGEARFAFVVPAHDEEVVIGATLDSLNRIDYPRDRYEVVVVADNCTDTTARIARDAGATVLKRTNRDLRGKGYALEWAFSLLLQRDAGAEDAVEAFVVVDADTEVAPGFLRAMESALWADLPAPATAEGRRRHRRALQGRYGVLNVGDSWRSALMAAAFDLFNHVKPLGRDHLGMSVGLKGNGMAFTRGTLETARWSGHSITEDIDYGLDLLQSHGVVVGYVPEAVVRAQMPVTASQAASQRERWERGRYLLLKERALPLLATGLRRGDLRRVEASLDLMTPPLAELAALHLLWGLLTVGALRLLPGGLPGNPAVWTALPAASLLGYLFYVIVGLRAADAPPEAYRALLRAPLYAPWKFALYAARFLRPRRVTVAAAAGAAVGGSGPEWVRTERTPMSLPPSGGAGSSAAGDSAADAASQGNVL